MNSKKMKYVHIALILVGLLAPALSPLITVLSTVHDHQRRFGYRVSLYPPHSCATIKKDIQFYTEVLPFNFMVAAGVTFLVLIFWKFYKVANLCNLKDISTVDSIGE